MVVSSKKLKVNLPENNDYDGRADLAQHMVHETTHAIQQDCDDRISDIDFYNNYFKGERDKRKAVNSFNVSNDIFNDLSFDVFAIADIISSELHFNKKNATNFDKVFKDTYNKTVEEEFQQRINSSITKFTENIGNNYSRKFILEYIIHHANDEIDAYTQGPDVDNSFINIFCGLSKAAENLLLELDEE